MAEFIQQLLGEHFESVIHVKVSKKNSIQQTEVKSRSTETARGCLE